DGDVLFHADEGHDTLHLGHDRVSVRIPLGYDSPAINLVAFLDGNYGTVGKLVTLTLAPEIIGYRQLTGTRHRHQSAVQTFHVLQVMQADGAAVLDQNVVDRRGPACRTTDVEGTHGQLGTGLTDGLRGDDAHRLTDVDL